MTTKAGSVYHGPWIASFRDGPLAGHEHDRIFAVGPIRLELYFFPSRREDEWVRVGDEHLPPEPEHPWPGQVRYKVESVLAMAGADGEPVAYYRLAEDGLTPAEALHPTEALRAAGD